ncbi:hypothetical protein JQC72_04700 [Polycladomyces sp. WAk]|uniref:Uncharacterized protein n=1 Tax=Polycladomyces zharkentensis TaxID=2807616 RepID=A0ABS2WH01_9BACL|nr:hypothetical protein [Polycladomyces sp. WAk]MBN2908822.1 hypothetical protein [Polycladomyces sp. WAk]
MSKSMVQKTLDGLKQRLVNNKLTIQQEEGSIMEVEFAFHEPATEQEIQNFTD